MTHARPTNDCAQLIADVEPYELMKLRLLNARHQGLCYFARLRGYRLVHDAAADPLIAAFLRTCMDEEGSPTLKPVPASTSTRTRASSSRASPTRACATPSPGSATNPPTEFPGGSCR